MNPPYHKSKTLYIVDAVNFLFRAYYAIGPMSTPEGKPTGALYGLIRSLYKIIQDFSPDYFVAVFDGEDNKKSRTEIYSGYKSHRTRMPEELATQLGEALTFCEIAGIPYLSLPGVEADDTIGSIAKWAEKEGWHVVICSSDKDLCQLVNDHVKVLNPQKENLLIDAKKVKEIFGVDPGQIIDLIALMGDTSDNIPGIEGIGPKTASTLLEQFGSVENLFSHLEQLPIKKQEQLSNGKEMALMSQKLATINLSVEIPEDPLFFHLKEPDLSHVTAFFHEMHFHSLLKELNPPKHKVFPHQSIETEKELEELIALLQKQSEICIDTETTDTDPMRATLVGIGLSYNGSNAYYIPCNGPLSKKKILSLLEPLLTNPHIHWIGHNIKYDLHLFYNEGIVLSPVGFDTMLASYLLQPHLQRHNLDDLSLTHLNHHKIPIEELIGKGKNTITMAEVPLKKITQYCCEDVSCTLALKHLFYPLLKEKNLLSILETIELPLISVLERMETNGIYVDKEKLQTLSSTFQEKITALEEKIETLAGEKINLNSPKQLGILLFEKLQIGPAKKTKTGYSTAADVLESLSDQHPIIPLLLTFRSLDKLRSTYTESLIDLIHPATGRIHCTFNQSVAATGRLSCQNPNLQNIPIRSPEGKLIRSAFKAEKKDHVFLSLDYSQIELRLLAHFSSDPTLIAAFTSGEDIHAHTASIVFDTPLASVTKEMRHLAKAVNFGILYGQQAYGLSQQLRIPVQEAKQFIDTYFERYTHVKTFLKKEIEQAREKGYAITLTGRKRPIPDIHHQNQMLRSQAERLATNTPLQGTAADLIKMAMIEVDAFLQKHPTYGKMILQIHDELLLEVPEEHLQTVSTHVKKIMENVVSLKVPLIVDISVGKNWGEC